MKRKQKLYNLYNYNVLQEYNSKLPLHNVLYRLYPYKSFLTEGESNVEVLLKSFRISPQKTESLSLQTLIEHIKHLKPKHIDVNDSNTYIETKYQNKLIEEMLQTTRVCDFCLIGPRSCGKSILVEKMAEILGKDTESIVLYQDMTSRDLIQQRTTLENGDTVWQLSPLVKAALQGKIAILDGIHRIHPSTLSVLHR